MASECVHARQVSEVTGMASSKAQETGERAQQQAGSATGTGSRFTGTGAGQQVTSCLVHVSPSVMVRHRTKGRVWD